MESDSDSVHELINDYITNLFFKKEEYEDDNSGYIGKSEDKKFYKRLSSIFNDIKDCDSIGLIIDELGKYIGEHPRFLMSKAQYIYNRAYFIDSEEHNSSVYDNARDILEKLLDEGENKFLAFQSLGVLNYRRLGALRKSPIRNEALIARAEKYIENVVKYCDRAYCTNPYDTYALVTKAQALKSYLNLIRDFLGYDNNDFKFCESTKYLEWTSQYELTLETISRFIANIDKGNTTASQNELLSIYEELRGFAFKLIGQSEEYIYDLYKCKLDSRNISNELKKLYANRLFNVLVEAPNNEIRNEKIGILADEKLSYIEQQLTASIRLGNLTGYEKIFRLHLFNGRKEYEITKELQWLKAWVDKDNSPLSQLWGNFFIGILYFSEILRQGFDQKGYHRSAQQYISESKRFADILKRNDTEGLFYFKKSQGLQCISENSNKATFIEGHIKEIKNNRQGIAILDCGLEATFAPKGEFLMEDGDKHTRIRAKIGFRFSGLGLYGVERIESMDTPEDKDSSTFLDSSKEYSLQKNVVSDSVVNQASQIIVPQNPPVNTNINSVDNEKYELKEDNIYAGVYHKDKFGKQYVTGDWKESWIQYLTIEGPVEDDIYDEAEIEFSVKKSINPDNGKEKWIAFDVSFPEDQ